jgi:alcohol dehydrogenase
MIATTMGARIIAIDIQEEKLKKAKEIGADIVINSREVSDIVAVIRDITHGGVQVSMDALGSPETCFSAISSLAKRGRHVQVGLMLADHKHPRIPMDLVIARELEIYGSHGIQAHRYDVLLGMIEAGKLHPERLIEARLNLRQGVDFLQKMDQFPGVGISVITSMQDNS